MTFDIITIFPDYFDSPLRDGVISRAISSGKIAVHTIDLRDFTTDAHRTTDDRPYGGGPGMVMLPAPLSKAIRHAKEKRGNGLVINLTPRGMVFNQQMARKLVSYEHIIVICGRYEGIDQRIVEKYVDLELSIGDFVLSGGEPAALVLMDAIGRLIPGVLGCENSALEDSFETGLLEYPHYTRPRVFEGIEVPEVLLSGHHKMIYKWRRKQSLAITLERRPDLLTRADLDAEDLAFLKRLGYELKASEK